MDTRRRTILKAVLWNLIGLGMMTLVGWIMTGSISFGGQMAGINAVLGLSMYVMYERIWARVRWGLLHG